MAWKLGVPEHTSLIPSRGLEIMSCRQSLEVHPSPVVLICLHIYDYFPAALVETTAQQA